MNSKKKLIMNINVYAETGVIPNGYVLFDENNIVEVGETPSVIEMGEVEVFSFPEQYALVPGFIDLHIHGAGGADTMDATQEALSTMAAILPKEGTTSFLATTMTTAVDDIEKALGNVANYISSSNPLGKAEVLGIHLEGPFISPKRVGAQHPQYILEPNIDLFKKWQVIANQLIKLVTLSPECHGGMELTSFLKETGVVASIGHSDATYSEVKEAIQAGVSHATHLYNQMRELHHREPGVIGAVLMNDEIKSEIIVDGVHSRPEMVRFAFKNKGSQGLILITDAMRAKCLGEGIYDLGGQEVTVTSEKATLKDGTLAGSILKLKDACQNMMKFTGCTLQEIVQMASENPAKQLGIFDRKGSIKPEKDADLVVLDEKGEVKLTFCRGVLAYHNQEEESK
ncbi:N-acetylglucosamine-6-phosphate deacetylase [Neobacillus sp. D3-1R]|uniref:N-acetylglucosamine-6-phosphate deacetylase n=1 Tax=Neobacillus sp. D3-1R TaxID=3445778 RepID=UPI003FA0603F